MFTYVLGFLSRLESKPVRIVLIFALWALVAGIFLICFVRWLHRRRKYTAGGWDDLLAGSLGAVLKALLGYTVVLVVKFGLSAQARRDENSSGGTAETGQ